MTTDSPEGTKTAAQLLREVAERDPGAHRRALARAYGCGAESSDTAIGSPAFEAAKESAQARGWVMEPSVISAMLTAAFSPLLERLDQQTTEIERLTQARDEMGIEHASMFAELAAAQARAEAAEAKVERVRRVAESDRLGLRTYGITGTAIRDALAAHPEPTVCACGHDRERHGVEAGCAERRCASISGVIYGPVRPLPEPEQS